MPEETPAGWILACLGHEGATLRDIIAYVDYRNHAILTYGEFSEALDHLGRKGTIARSGSQLTFAPGSPSQPGIGGLFSPAEFKAAVEEYLSPG